ncbi:MAG: helix-turn-helix transcriptional regulator [Methyloceanibacter sp.]|uniref:helix-turn-helix transcriptional regulator n=1 Tax=Methyloceanibacter sp. TaxID=1965321 RepID=UPI003D6D3CDD
MPNSRAALDWLLREDDDERAVPVSERVEVDDDHWRMSTERLDIGPGMWVFLSLADVWGEPTLEPRHEEPSAWLCSNIAVKGKVSLSLSDGLSTDITDRCSVLYRAVDKRARFSPAPSQRLQLAGYMLRSDRVRQMLGESLPAMLPPLIDENAVSSKLIEVPVGVRVRQAAGSLFTTKLRGALRLLFLEGVVLQLLAMQTARLDRGVSGRENPLSPKERSSILEARDLLLANMRHPPSLAALAAEVGLNEKALNAGFKELFGTTVFETLRNERLEHARQALENEDLPVKRIAFRVGYNHVNNFINAFTARYGTPPRKYRVRRSER